MRHNNVYIAVRNPMQKMMALLNLQNFFSEKVSLKSQRGTRIANAHCQGYTLRQCKQLQI